MENYDSAEKDFLEAINLGMKNGLVYSLLGSIFRYKKVSKSIPYYDLAINYYKKDEYLANAYFWRGYSLLKINNIDDACADFKIAYKLGEIYEKTYKKYCNP